MGDLGLGDDLEPNPNPDITAAAGATPAPQPMPAPALTPAQVLMMPQPVARGSGLSNEQSLQNQDTNREENTTTTTNRQLDASKVGSNRNVYDVGQFQRNVQGIMDTPVVRGQLEDNDNLRALLAQIASRKATLNLSPLYDAANYVTGGQSGKYQPAPEVSEREALLLGQAQKLIQNKRDIANEAIKNAAALKVGTDTDLQQKTTALDVIQRLLDERGGKVTSASKVTASDPNKAARIQSPQMLTKWVQTEAAKQVQPLAKEFEGVQHGMDLLAKASSVNDFAATDAFIKSQVGGRVTNYDLQRQQGDRAWTEKLSQAAQTVLEGTLTPNNRAEFVKALQTIGEAINGERNQRLSQVKEYANQLGKPGPEVDALLGGFARTTPAPRGDAARSLNQKATNTSAATGPQGPTVVQGGHTYTWNPKTKAYE